MGQFGNRRGAPKVRCVALHFVERQEAAHGIPRDQEENAVRIHATVVVSCGGLLLAGIVLGRYGAAAIFSCISQQTRRRRTRATTEKERLQAVRITDRPAHIPFR